jgi:hypothetical protein
MADVPGAKKVVLTIEDCPAGMAFTTAFYDAEGRADPAGPTHRRIPRVRRSKGDASLYRPPVLLMPGAA